MSEVISRAEAQEWAEPYAHYGPPQVYGLRRAVAGDIYERGCGPRCWANHIPGYTQLHVWRLDDDREYITALKAASTKEFREQFLGSWDVPYGR